jgi:tRNA(adenine34) deaminase
MCAGAIVLSRIERLFFGVFDKKAGACGSLYNIVQDIRLNHQVLITPYVKEIECAEILQRFFQELRAKKD